MIFVIVHEAMLARVIWTGGETELSSDVSASGEWRTSGCEDGKTSEPSRNPQKDHRGPLSTRSDFTSCLCVATWRITRALELPIYIWPYPGPEHDPRTAELIVCSLIDPKARVNYLDCRLRGWKKI